MRVRLRPALLTFFLVVGAFALGGCSEDEDGLSTSATLIIDDDRTTGPTITVFYTLGTEAPRTTTIDAGQTRVLAVAQGTYTVTFDDDGTGGVTASDTKETAVQVETNKTTTVEYAGQGNSGVIGPNLQANG